MIPYALNTANLAIVSPFCYLTITKGNVCATTDISSDRKDLIYLKPRIMIVTFPHTFSILPDTSLF